MFDKPATSSPVDQQSNDPPLLPISRFLGVSLERMQDMMSTEEFRVALDRKVDQHLETLKEFISKNPTKTYPEIKSHWQDFKQALDFLSVLQDEYSSIQHFFSEGYFVALFLRARNDLTGVDAIPFTELSPQEFYICLDQLKMSPDLFNAVVKKLDLACLNQVFDDAVGMCNWKLLTALYSPEHFRGLRMSHLETMLRSSSTDDARILSSKLNRRSGSPDLFVLPSATGTSNASSLPQSECNITNRA